MGIPFIRSHRDIFRVRNILVFLLMFFSVFVLIIARNFFHFRIRNFFIILLPLTVSYIATPIISRIATKLNILDTPGERKVHKTPTPLLGGLAVYLAFGIGAVSTLWYSFELKGVVYAATMIFLLGLADDIFDLSSVFRLIVQLLAVFVLFYHGLEVDFIPDTTRYHIFEKLVTILWVIGITNAVNFLDGLDGLCAGYGAIASMFFGAAAFLTGQYFLMFLAFSLTGSCFGFLPWNFRAHEPAKIFLGDSGSNFIGFTLASFALMGDWAENNVVALTVPILILFLPIYDTSMTTFFRVRDGSVRTVRQWLDYVGKDHFHHRLYAMGIGKRNAVWTMYLMTSLLGCSAIIIRTGGTLEAYLALIQAALVLVFFTALIVDIRKKYDVLENKKIGVKKTEK